MMHLIAHIVLGQPEFAIAHKIEEGTPSDPGPWWIVQSGGWRAWPYWTCSLDELYIKSDSGVIPLFLPEAPGEWPDFVKKVAPIVKKLKRSGKIDLEELGL